MQYKIVPANVNPQSILEITPIINKYGGIYTIFTTLFSFIIFFDIGMVLFNKKEKSYT